ncbi:MAG: hypothetical protein SFX74_07225 [Fimbriimonadaceae bacterium]|nr:hypothetical protein [Fimbriimonadaceae bacterium]
MAAWVALSALANGELVDNRAYPLPVIDQTSGADSLVSTPAVRLARSQDEFANLWLSHRGGPNSLPGVGFQTQPMPQLDFRRVMVVAAFAGEVPNSGAFRYVSGVKQGKLSTIRLAYQPMAGIAAIQGRPFTFFVIPRAETKVQIDLVEGQRIRTVAEFGALEKKRN